ncbi:metal-dependent hydrolase [Candidatus Uabimicrobium sp. HlEnr_7]|uniref:metal-dependent hydrolase n=1 Tax=Candidatus Uabimicrobium helgolandensis TaxID=3095367 RepID=UPI00355699C4
MDIVTHAMIGVIIGLPLTHTAPVLSSGFILGSVLPDVDAFSRLFGKYAFLKFHQTYTHSVPLILLSMCIVTAIMYFTFPLLTLFPVGIAAGMIGHAFLDLTNTYGIKILLPFSRKRLCYEWMFFVDTPAVILCGGYFFFIASKLHTASPIPTSTSYTFCIILAMVCFVRCYMRNMAQRIAPQNTLSLIPSALKPWLYFGSLYNVTHITTFKLSILSKTIFEEQQIAILDEKYPQITNCEDFKTMQSLSPLYHVVEEKENVVVSRDLRIRNFNTNFGRLDITLSEEKQIVKTFLNV